MHTLKFDKERGAKVAEILFRTFNMAGIFGRNDMPEDKPPKGVKRGSIEHALFITLTVAIDYMRDANQLWNAARLTYKDETTRWLFNPSAVSKVSFNEVLEAMKKYGLSKRHKEDARIWKTISKTLDEKWDGNPLKINVIMML